MSENKSHYNTQFLGDPIKIPVEENLQIQKPQRAKSNLLAILLVAILGPV